ncbi:MAG: NAD(P)H-dependent oxidoreductase [Actinomycetota bacterium]|nr:NAD(P)H-dependent oxidoreductase [Actinomycetota bacterium]
MTKRDPLHVGVIVASTRPGRIGGAVAEWFMGQARQRTDMTFDVIDLIETDLPAVLVRGADPVVDAYLSRLDAADAFVVVTPEYNHGYPAPLKQAIDLARTEWFAKPVAFVAYGGMAGGMRAVEQLRQVFAELHATTIRDVVGFHRVRGQFDEGTLSDAEGANLAAKTMLDQLAWWATALRDARLRQPYAA